MEDSLENFITSQFDIKQHYTTHLAALAVENTIMTRLSEDHSDELALFMALQTIIIRNLTGWTADLETVRHEMERTNMIVVNGYLSLMMDLKQQRDINEMTQTPSGLRAMRDVDVLAACQFIGKKVTPFIPALADHGLSIAKVGLAIANTSAYEQFFTAPSAERDASVIAGERTDECVARMRILREKMVVAHEVIKDVLPNEYSSFRLALDIPDTGGPNVPPTYPGVSIPTGISMVAENIYNAGRRYKFRNHSTTQALLLSLSTEEASPTNPPRLLNAGATSSLLSSTLGPNGDYLLIQNTSPDTILVDIWVIE